MKLKKGDNIIVITGKHKGVKGTITRTTADRVFVDGVNMMKHHIKAKSKTEKGSIIEKEASINASNVMLIEGGKRIRASKRAKTAKPVKKVKKEAK